MIGNEKPIAVCDNTKTVIRQYEETTGTRAKVYKDDSGYRMVIDDGWRPDGSVVRVPIEYAKFLAQTMLDDVGGAEVVLPDDMKYLQDALDDFRNQFLNAADALEDLMKKEHPPGYKLDRYTWRFIHE